jgi:hypothetical protein
MGIFILIICCFYTLSGLKKLFIGLDSDEGEKVGAGLIITLLGTLAIIFQSILL